MKKTSPRKVLYVINGFRQGGAENGLATLLEHGFMKGVDFRVFAFVQGSPLLRARVERLIGKDKLIQITTDEKLTLRALFLGTKALFHTVLTFKPSVVILSLKQSNIIGRAVLTFFPSISCIAFEHNTKLEQGRFSRFYETMLRLLSYRVDEIWADSRSTLKETKTYYIWPRKRRSVVVPLFACTPNITCKQDYKSQDRFQMVMAGRLIPRKRHDLVLKALARLIRNGANVTLTIFGTGPCEKQLRKTVKTLHLENWVFFKGFVENWWQEAASYDLFVNASEREGFCIVVAEAMMIGLPALITPIGGIKDYTEDGVDSEYVEVGSAEALEKAIRQLSVDHTKRRRLGLAAAQKIQKLFAPSVLQKEIRALTDWTV